MTTNMEQDKDIAAIRRWIGGARQRIEAMADVLDAYGALLEERLLTRRAVREMGLPPMAPDADKTARGVPLLVDEPLEALEPLLYKSARRMVPALAGAFPALSAEMLRVLAGVEDGSLPPVSMAEALVRGDAGRLAEWAAASPMREQSLAFAVAEISRPVLQEMAADLTHLVPETGWLQSACPVCGALPDLAVFRPVNDDNEYLKNYGGQRWLHCPRCATQWRFRRHVCPNCANEDNGSLSYYAGTAQGERADVCLQCKRYMVGLDVRQFIEEPDLDVAALALVPLDILVQRKGFAPLASTPWNTLG